MDLTQMAVDIAGLQANVAWLTRLVWAMIALNGASLLTNGIVGTIVVRNNNQNQKGK